MSDVRKLGATRWLIAALAGAVALAAVAGASAQSPDATDGHVEVRVWQGVADSGAIYLSARPLGGAWGEGAPAPLALDGTSDSGRWRYGDAAISGVDVRVWQRVTDDRRLWISMRRAGDSWRTVGTVPLDMSGASGSGAYRYGDLTTREPLRLGLLDLETLAHIFFGNRHDGPHERAAELAIKHINDAGGVFGKPVEAHYADTLDGDAVDHARQLLREEDVHAFVGPLYSRDTVAVANAVAVPNRIPLISPVSASTFLGDLDDDGYVFRTVMSSAAEGVGVAMLAHDEGYDHVVVLKRDADWGDHMTAAFREHFDGEVTELLVVHDLDATAYSSAPAEELEQHIEEALDHGADAVAFFTSTAAVRHIMEVLTRHELFDVNLLFLHRDRSRDFLARFPEALDGQKGVAFLGQHVTEAEGHWEADYEAEYGGEVPHVAYMRETYDAAMALMLAAEYAGTTDGAAIRDALHVIAGPPGDRYPASSAGVAAALAAIRAGEDIDLDGEASDLNWDERGDLVTGDMLVWRFTNGAIEDVRHFVVDLRE